MLLIKFDLNRPTGLGDIIFDSVDDDDDDDDDDGALLYYNLTSDELIKFDLTLKKSNFLLLLCFYLQ